MIESEDFCFEGKNNKEMKMGAAARSSGLASAPVGADEVPEDENHPEYAILFLGVSLVLGVISRQLLKGTRIPYTVALLILGIALGALEHGTHPGLGSLGASIRIWSSINPELILFVFLPALLFESSFAMEVHQLKRCIMQMVLLAGPGVIISTACLALVLRYLFPYGWNWSTCLLLGGLLSATDPVAVVALLKELGCSKKLNTIVEGESLMNDGTAIVVYQLFLKMMLGETFTAGKVVKFFCQTAFGAVSLGLGIGLVAVLWIGRVFNDTLIEITLTFTASYLAFFVAEDEADVSGILTVMTIGIFFAVFARTAFTGESEHSMHLFWEMITYIANTLIFILSGVIIAESVLRSQDSIQSRDWGYLVLLFLFLQVSRAVVVGTLYPGLKYFGYGLQWKEAVVLIWAGLRGAVALSLSVSVNQVGQRSSGGHTYITKQTGARFVFFTGGIVLLTLVINGSSTQFLLTLLHMDKTPQAKELILDYVRYEMYSKALESFGELGDDEDLGPTDWASVSKYISSLGQADEGITRPAHPHAASATGEMARRIAFHDTRIRFLNGVQAAYWGMLGEGRITRTAALLLMGSVDEALDHVEKDVPIRDWDGVRPHVKFPKFLKWKGSTVLPERLLTRLKVSRLELACYMAAAFLRAHRIAQHELRGFIGESEIADAVIRESQFEGQEARDYLEDVRLSFPQVLRAIKTKQVTHAVLVNLSTYVTNLEEAGLLEAKETNHLRDLVQVDLKKLQRKPPLIQITPPMEALNNQPFFGALPAHVQSLLFNHVKELMFFRDNEIYKADTKGGGIWLIANGNVKWSAVKDQDQHTLHPVFSFGTTLGLYEALTGKPFLCTITADTVVECFFIEKEILLSTIRTEPGLEEFLWQESALVVAKLAVPRHFEAVTMQDLRVLIQERSRMHTYIRGELIAVETSKMAILLEGFVKQEGKSVVIGAPAGLLSSLMDGQAERKGSWPSLIYQTLYYHAEARSRVLFMEFQPEETASPFPSMNAVLPREPSSTSERSLKRYHSSKDRLPHTNSKLSFISLDNAENPIASYTSRAAELAIFGRQINDRSKLWRRQLIKNVLGASPSSPMGHSSSAGIAASGMANSRSQSYPLNLKRPVRRPHFSSDNTLTTVAQNNRSTYHDQRRIYSQENLMSRPPRPARLRNLRVQNQGEAGYSSGDSDLDEHIVEIVSPSSLFPLIQSGDKDGR